jgi:hypothetical protein
MEMVLQAALDDAQAREWLGPDRCLYVDVLRTEVDALCKEKHW